VGNPPYLCPGNTKGGSTVDLLFDRFGISCMTADNFCFYLQNRLIQTSQTGGQWYNDTSPFSIPCCVSRFTWPVTVQAIMFLMAAWDTLSPETQRPATSKLSTLTGTRHPYGTWKSLNAVFGGNVKSGKDQFREY
jgi:hypothetical protein